MLYVQPGLWITFENTLVDTPLLIFSSTASWCTDGYRGRKLKKLKGWKKPEFLAEISCLLQKVPRKSRIDTPGSLNNQVPSQEHEHYCHSFIQHSTWLLVSILNTNVWERCSIVFLLFLLFQENQPAPCVCSEINKFLNYMTLNAATKKKKKFKNLK